MSRPDAPGGGYTSVLLYPAIDILDGQAVRLSQGHFDDRTVYHDDPLDAARAWRDAGARALHVVDLDGARSGTPAHLDALARIVAEVGIPVQTGGGLRSEQAVSDALGAGVSRVVLGTAAYRDPAFLDAILAQHGPSQVAVAVDVRNGELSGAGWTQGEGMTALEAIARLCGQGIETVIYTDVDRDGMMGGPDLDDVAAVIAAVGGQTMYSGGIGNLEHLRSLATLDLEGVIVGKALFEKAFTVEQGQNALEGAAA